MTRATTIRTLHDVGLAAWFGGTLMGAIGVNGAAAAVDDPRQASRVANAGWAKWTPVNAAAIGAHLVGGALIVQENKGRLAAQQGVAAATAVKTAITAAALGATAYSRVLGGKMKKAGDVPIAGGTEPTAGTPPEVAAAQKQLKALQWLIPALTGGIIVANVYQGEQQRPTEVVKGIAGRLADVVQHPASLGAAAQTAVKNIL